jgi:hypothetical protein
VIEEDVMGALVVNMFMSLDGIPQGPGGPEEDRAGGFAYGGWQAPYVDEESGKVITDHRGLGGAAARPLAACRRLTSLGAGAARAVTPPPHRAWLAE